MRRRHEGSLDRRVAAPLEQVHERLPEQVARVSTAEEIAPGRVHVDDDAFLHVRDRIGRAGHERAHLIAVLPRRGQRAIERLVEAGRVEFARGDGLQPPAGAERDDVLRAEFQAAHEVRLGERLADDERRHARGES